MYVKLKAALHLMAEHFQSSFSVTIKDFLLGRVWTHPPRCTACESQMFPVGEGQLKVESFIPVECFVMATKTDFAICAKLLPANDSSLNVWKNLVSAKRYEPKYFVLSKQQP